MVLTELILCGICMTYIDAESNRRQITCIMVVTESDWVRIQNLPNRIGCGVKKNRVRTPLMLNLSVIQNLIANPACLLFEMYITRGQKMLTYPSILCKFIKRKIKYNKEVTCTDSCLVAYHSTILTVVMISSTQFCIWQKIGWGYGLFVRRNGKLEMVVEPLPKLFM